MSGISDIFEQLSELDQDNIGSWPTWAYAGALAIVAAVILGGGWWYFVTPKQDTLKELRHKETQLKQTFMDEHRKVASLDEYKAQLATMRKEFDQMLDNLPTQTEIPSLLNAISQTRLTSGLEEKLFKPLEPVDKGFYVVLPNAMTVTGQYHELAEFVSKVASLPRIVTIDSVSIKPINSNTKGELQMTMTIKTYRYSGDGKGDN